MSCGLSSGDGPGCHVTGGMSGNFISSTSPKLHDVLLSSSFWTRTNVMDWNRVCWHLWHSGSYFLAPCDVSCVGPFSSFNKLGWRVQAFSLFQLTFSWRGCKPLSLLGWRKMPQVSCKCCHCCLQIAAATVNCALQSFEKKWLLMLYSRLIQHCEYLGFCSIVPPRAYFPGHCVLCKTFLLNNEEFWVTDKHGGEKRMGQRKKEQMHAIPDQCCGPQKIATSRNFSAQPPPSDFLNGLQIILKPSFS